MTEEEAKRFFRYEPMTGYLYWLVTTAWRVKVGDQAGWDNAYGYRRLRVQGREYFAHHIVWLYHHGKLPKEIDHIDGDPSNNRIENLRVATHAQNLANTKRRCDNTSGFKGVRLHKHSGLWNARIKAHGKVRSLGYFKTPELAGRAYAAAASKYFGEFSRVE
jgi:hypothetical protein